MNGNTPDRKLLKQINGIQSRVGSALLNTDLTAEEVATFPVKNLGEITAEAAMFIVARIRGIEPGQQANAVIQKNPDGSISVVKTVRGRSDEDLVARVKEMGWNYINPAIRTERRIKVSGKPEIETGSERTLTIEQVVPQDSTWKFKKAVAATRPTPLGFDLEDMVDMLEHRDELLALGVRWIVAPAARFRNGNGHGCVVYANLEDRKLCLFWVGSDWDDNDWFGSSK